MKPSTLLSLLILPLISGCSIMGVYEGGFDCPPGKGVSCKSISEVNEKINKGELPPKAEGVPASEEDRKDCKSCKGHPQKTFEGDIWWKDPLWFEAYLNRAEFVKC